MKKRCRTGVTLMELLLAVSLLSVLSVGILFALRVGLNAMEKTNSAMIANRRVAGAQRALERQIGSLMPVVAACRTNPQAPPTKIFFFQGAEQSMRFVSSYSLQEAARGYPRILEFQVIPGEDHKGVRLVVNEKLYSGPFSTGALCLGIGPDPLLGTLAPQFLPIEIGPGSFVLADRLAHCRFSFQEAVPPPVGRRWVTRWIKPEVPLAIRIDMAPLERDPARIRVATIIAPVRVNRNPLLDYVDVDEQ